MTLTQQLADRALAPLASPDADRLRALTAGNLAAGAGFLGYAGDLLGRLPLDATRPGDAAFLHAGRLHARTQDDFHPYGRIHVGVVTLAATLALADQAGDRLLDCLTGGYEVMCCAATAYSRDAQRRGYRPTGIFGPLGAAASAAIALGLDRDGIANAIGLAAARSAGTMQSWISGTDEWVLEVGAAARAGLEAAVFTQAGAIAAPVAIEGAAGWACAYFQDDGAKLAGALAHQASYVSEVAAKPYPVSGIAQVSTDLACRAHHEIDLATVTSVTITIAEPEAAYPGSLNKGPFRARSDRLMSVAFCIACGLTDGAVTLGRLEGPYDDLTRLISLIDVHADPGFEESEAVLTVTTADGSREWAGSGPAVLDPDWQTLRDQADQLARRNEANPHKVAHLIGQLDTPRPDARTLTADQALSA